MSIELPTKSELDLRSTIPIQKLQNTYIQEIDHKNSGEGVMRSIFRIFGRSTPTKEPVDVVGEVSLDEVFPGASQIVRHSYVARPEAESRVAESLREANAIICFWGPSKSGKTVLASRLSGPLPKAHLHAFGNLTSDEFWQSLGLAINAPNRVEYGTGRKRSHQDTGSVQLGGSIGTPLFDAHAKAGTTSSEMNERSVDERSITDRFGRIGVIEHLKKNPFTIIIDDFHWMNPDLIEDIFPPLKQVLALGSKIILISVSKNVFPTIGDLGDFTGRFFTVQMPPWTAEEIQQIGILGFKALNVTASRETVENLQKRAYFSPLLMQGLCHLACADDGIEHSSSTPRKLGEINSEDAGKLAARLAEPKCDSFETILSDTAEKKYHTKSRDGRVISLTELFLVGISHTRPFQPFHFDELVKRVKNNIIHIGNVKSTLNVDGDELDSRLKALLKQKAASIQNHLGGKTGDRSPIFYDKRAETVTIVDPYFKLWVRWVKGGDLAGSLYDN